MPLLDHFRPPLYPKRSWQSFLGTCAAMICTTLNKTGLPTRDCFAEIQSHIGGRVEVDDQPIDEPNQGVADWKHDPPAFRFPTLFPDEIEVQVHATRDGASLVGAIELVSPGNKDRPEARRAFDAKCASYLQMGFGLVIVDVVTDRLANLHDTLMGLLDLPKATRFPGDSSLYTVSYRPSRRDPGGDQIEVWLYPLRLGETLPTVPLPLRRGPTLPLNLETTYTETRQASRL